MVTFEAKNVVVARPSFAQGRVEVLESWRGDLLPGAKISLAEIASVGSDSKRLVYSQNKPTRQCLAGERMVLFLAAKSDDGTFRFARPASLSLLIVEGGKVWAPSLPKSYSGFGDFAVDETELHGQVSVAGAFADELAAATALADGAARARALAPLVVTSSSPVRWRAVNALRQCGADATPVLRALVRRGSLLSMRGELLSLLRESSNEAFTTELKSLLAEESRYWKRIGHTLEESWWTGAGASGPAEAEYMKARVQHTRQLLDWSRHAGNAAITEAANALCEVWKSDAKLAPARAWIGIPVPVQARR